MLSRASYVALSLATSAVYAVAGISDEHVGLIATIVGVVTVVAGGIAWLDKRVDSKIKKHEEAEFKRQEEERRAAEELDKSRAQLETERHEGILREIQHVRELIDIKEEVKRLIGGNRG